MTGSKLVVLRALYLAAFLALVTAYVSEAASPIRQLTNTTASNLRPAWSPDGKRIAFQSNREGPYHIYVMDSDGGNVSQLTNGDSDDRHPAWSPDGKYLAVDSGDTAKREIWTIEVSSKRRTQVTKLGAIASFPSWSPDGKHLGFYVYQDASMDVWTVASEGGNQTRLTRDLASEGNNQCTFACHAVAWSPDGSRIAVADGDQARVLLLAATNGSVSAPITPVDERSHFPVYLPDGSLVYVSEHVTIDQSWTDLWMVDPNAANTIDARTAVAGQIQAQGPFGLSNDVRQLLFASPRSGNFEIYSVTLDAAGKAALAAKPERISPDLSSAESKAVDKGFRLPDTPEPYVLAAGLLAFAVVGVESIVRARRRSRAKAKP